VHARSAIEHSVTFVDPAGHTVIAASSVQLHSLVLVALQQRVDVQLVVVDGVPKLHVQPATPVTQPADSHPQALPGDGQRGSAQQADETTSEGPHGVVFAVPPGSEAVHWQLPPSIVMLHATTEAPLDDDVPDATVEPVLPVLALEDAPPAPATLLDVDATLAPVFSGRPGAPAAHDAIAQPTEREAIETRVIECMRPIST
jgi:hypothetical protein